MSETITLQVGVKVALRGQDGRFLLLHRSSEKYPDIDGRWDLVGGRINPGKDLFTNLQREVREETKLNLDAEPVLIAAQDILRTKGRHVVRLTFIGRIEGEPILDEEHDEYRWFTFDELESLPESELDIYVRDLINRGLFKKPKD
ncbi:NUDIX hydrolase [Candidatus Dojkabacteria bacterium]|uniref:NUDIX hydrolase n=1 Tax=Candidatus Dojkabacteria bacterium TaxID=2099670 RepID=A0A955L390_9BACT|nr:NUDIX hydrolase [Candidatus Dojkabacteria bacterium]